MSFDSLVNRGEYFSGHYLAEVLVRELKKGILARWAEEEKSSGRRTPRLGLRALRRPAKGDRGFFDDLDFFREYAARADDDLPSDQDRAEWVKKLHELHLAVLTALGFPAEEREIEVKTSAGKIHHVPVAYADRNVVAIECGWATAADSALDDPETGLLLGPVAISGRETIKTGAKLVSFLFGADQPPRYVLILAGGVVILADRHTWGESRYLAVSLDVAFGRGDLKPGGELDVIVVAASASGTTRHDVRISAGRDDEPYGDPEYWIEQSRRYLPDMLHIREPRFPWPGWRIRPPHVVRPQPPSEEHRPVRPKPTPKVERPPATPRERVQPAPRLIPRPAKSISEAEKSPDVPLPSRTAKPTPTDTPTRGSVAPTPATVRPAVPEAHPTPVAPDVPARNDSEVVVAFGSGALVGISFAAVAAFAISRARLHARRRQVLAAPADPPPPPPPPAPLRPPLAQLRRAKLPVEPDEDDPYFAWKPPVDTAFSVKARPDVLLMSAPAAPFWEHITPAPAPVDQARADRGLPRPILAPPCGVILAEANGTELGVDPGRGRRTRPRRTYG